MVCSGHAFRKEGEGRKPHGNRLQVNKTGHFVGLSNLPAAAGGQQWPAGALQWARRSLPPEGEGRGDGGDIMHQDKKIPPPMDGQRPGPKWPGRRCPCNGPGFIILAQAAQPVKGHFRLRKWAQRTLDGQAGLCMSRKRENPSPRGAALPPKRPGGPQPPGGPTSPGEAPGPAGAGAAAGGGPGRREGPREGQGRARSGARPTHPRRAGRCGRRARPSPREGGPRREARGRPAKGAAPGRADRRSGRPRGGAASRARRRAQAAIARGSERGTKRAVPPEGGQPKPPGPEGPGLRPGPDRERGADGGPKHR